MRVKRQEGGHGLGQEWAEWPGGWQRHEMPSSWICPKSSANLLIPGPLSIRLFRVLGLQLRERTQFSWENPLVWADWGPASLAPSSVACPGK